MDPDLGPIDVPTRQTERKMTHKNETEDRRRIEGDDCARSIARAGDGSRSAQRYQVHPFQIRLVQALIDNLIERRLDPTFCRLFILDGDRGAEQSPDFRCPYADPAVAMRDLRPDQVYSSSQNELCRPGTDLAGKAAKRVPAHT